MICTKAWDLSSTFELKLTPAVVAVPNLFWIPSKSTSFFLSKHSTSLFKCILKNNGLGIKHKLFGITDNTKRRLVNVPTEELTGGKLIGLKEKAGETGYVFFNDIYFIYSISLSGICIITSGQKNTVKQSHHEKVFQNTHSDREEELLFSMTNTVSGFIYIDFFSEELSYRINNIVDLLQNPDNLLVHCESTKPKIKKMVSEMDESKNPIDWNLDDV